MGAALSGARCEGTGSSTSDGLAGAARFGLGPYLPAAAARAERCVASRWPIGSSQSAGTSLLSRSSLSIAEQEAKQC